MRVYRLLAIVMLLLNKEKVSAAEFAEQFEVSPRTIYRDIEAICQAGIPIVSFQGTDGGFSIMDNYKIDKNLFTPDEFLSILAALEGLNTSLKDRDIKNITEKIKALFPEKDSHLQEQNQIIMDLTPWGDNKEIKVKLDILKQAIKESKVIEMNYVNSKRELSRRKIEPVTLALKATTWYLYAYCRLREDYRIFRLSRMTDITTTGQVYQKVHKSFNEFEEENQWEQKGKEVDLVMKFKAEAYLQIQDYFSEKDIEEKEDGSFVVRVTFPEDQWVYSFILSFADSVEVLSPPHIRDIIKRMSKNIYDKYD
ncbi:MAG: helix-turn-helix transcriptional regulator [Halanaerobiales bacterium]